MSLRGRLARERGSVADGNGEAPAAPAVAAELHITLDHAGQIRVTGPLENRVLCYGLLGLAQEVVAAQADKPKKSGLLRLPGRLLGG